MISCVIVRSCSGSMFASILSSISSVSFVGVMRVVMCGMRFGGRVSERAANWEGSDITGV